MRHGAGATRGPPADCGRGRRCAGTSPSTGVRGSGMTFALQRADSVLAVCRMCQSWIRAQMRLRRFANSGMLPHEINPNAPTTGHRSNDSTPPPVPTQQTHTTHVTSFEKTAAKRRSEPDRRESGSGSRGGPAQRPRLGGAVAQSGPVRIVRRLRTKGTHTSQAPRGNKAIAALMSRMR